MRLPPLPPWLGGKKESPEQKRMRDVCLELSILSSEIPCGGGVFTGAKYSYKSWGGSQEIPRGKVEVMETGKDFRHVCAITFLDSPEAVEVVIPGRVPITTNNLQPNEREVVIQFLQQFTTDISAGIRAIADAKSADFEGRRNGTITAMRELLVGTK